MTKKRRQSVSDPTISRTAVMMASSWHCTGWTRPTCTWAYCRIPISRAASTRRSQREFMSVTWTRQAATTGEWSSSTKSCCASWWRKTNGTDWTFSDSIWKQEVAAGTWWVYTQRLTEPPPWSALLRQLSSNPGGWSSLLKGISTPIYWIQMGMSVIKRYRRWWKRRGWRIWRNNSQPDTHHGQGTSGPVEFSVTDRRCSPGQISSSE